MTVKVTLKAANVYYLQIKQLQTDKNLLARRGDCKSLPVIQTFPLLNTPHLPAVPSPAHWFSRGRNLTPGNTLLLLLLVLVLFTLLLLLTGSQPSQNRQAGGKISLMGLLNLYFHDSCDLRRF